MLDVCSEMISKHKQVVALLLLDPKGYIYRIQIIGCIVVVVVVP